jgi:hypothetical protein
MSVAEELKVKRPEIGARIEAIRIEVTELKRQQSAIDAVIAICEPGYAVSAPRVRRGGRKAAASGPLDEVFKGIDRRNFVLKTLREAGKPITTADCAAALAREVGLPDGDTRLGQIGNKFSQVLDQLAKSKRVRRAGMIDGHRHLWEIAA